MTPRSSRRGKNREYWDGEPYRDYVGEPFGTRVANWLNRKRDDLEYWANWPEGALPTRAAVARITKLVELVQAAVDADGKLHRHALDELRDAVLPYRFRLAPSWTPTWLQIITEKPKSARAQELMRAHAPGGSGFDKPAEGDDLGRLTVDYVCTRKSPYGEAVVLWWLFGLALKGVQHRLRRCQHCGKWLFAHFDTQTFCAGGACRSAHRAQDEAYAEVHRKRMKQRYWDIKTGKCKPRKRR